MKIIGYARVSSKEQAENSNALAQQILRLKAAGANEIISEVETGSSDTRIKFRSLLNLVANNQVQEVIVTRLDRLTRSLKTTVEIREIFLASHCNLRALDDQIDLSSPTGKFHFSLLGSLAEMEVDRLGERIRYGHSAKRKKGEVFKAPFGYTINQKSKLVYDLRPTLCLLSTKQEFKGIDLAFFTLELFNKHQSLAQTTKQFNLLFGIKTFSKTKRFGSWYRLGWSINGLRTWLNSPFLLGHTFYPSSRDREPSIIYNTHEPLISLNDFENIKRIIQTNKRFKGFTKKSQVIRPTSGLLFCSQCHSRIYHYTSKIKNNGKQYTYNRAQCTGAKQGLCDRKKTINTDLIQTAIINRITEKAIELSQAVVANDLKPEFKSTEILTLEKQLQGLQQLTSLGNNPAIEQSIREIKNQIQSLQLTNQLHTSSTKELEDLLLQVFAIPDFWQQQTPENLTAIFQKIIAKVIINEGRILEVFFNL